jgi:hypothetical protein
MTAAAGDRKAKLECCASPYAAFVATSIGSSIDGSWGEGLRPLDSLYSAHPDPLPKWGRGSALKSLHQDRHST